MKVFRFNSRYMLFALLLFVVEVCIALFMHDRFVRPFVGDFLVVILIYCFVKAFMNVSNYKLAIGVLLFSFLVEYLQYIGIVNILGLENSSLARTVIGTSFEWTDLIAYALGILTVLLLDREPNSRMKTN